jgi:uncharacterized membrane protein
MFFGFLWNTFAPFERPLDKHSSLLLVSLIFWFLFLFSHKKIKGIKILLSKYLFFNSFYDVVFVFVSIFFVFASILGAVLLNNNGTNAVTMITLFGMFSYIIILFFNKDKISNTAVPTILFFFSLALLFITSLRGWYISGHDIQREFFVFQLAKDAGVWNMANYRDAYNACLSITILPTMVSNLLTLSDVYIYKVLYQLFFALSPVIVYFVSLNWANRTISTLSAFYFLAFPTFFQDMPFLTRQEIAFLFFGSMLLIVFQKHIKNKLRQALFVLFGAGVILSHYSTTYTVVFVFGLTVLFMPFFRKIINKYRDKKIFKLTALDAVYEEKDKERKKIKFWSVVLVAVLSVFWTNSITNTSGHLAKVTSELTDAVVSGFGGARSADALSFFTFGVKENSEELFGKYKKEVDWYRGDSKDEYFSDDVVSKYDAVFTNKYKLPMTKMGNLKIMSGLKLSDITFFVGQSLIKFLELGVVIGIVYVIFRRRMIGTIDAEYYVLSAFSIFFVGLNIILPILSIEYGVFRALQQSMFIIGPFIVIGIYFMWAEIVFLFKKVQNFVTQPFGKKYVPFKLNNMVPVIFVAFFLLYSSGFVSQAMGNNYPLMQLNNIGNDYDHYYVTEKEHDAIYWLRDFLNENENENQVLIQADRYGQKKIQSIINTETLGSIYPGIVKKKSYVFLTPSNIKDKKAVVMYNGQVITYTYPVEFLDDNKDLIYDNGEVRIYR